MNDEVCFSQNPMYENIKYSDLSKTQERVVCRAINVIKKQFKLLAHKTWHLVILGYFKKYRSMKYFLSDINIIITFSIQDITSQNQFQIRFLDKFLFKQKVDKKMIINTIISSILESTFTSDVDDENIGDSKREKT